MREGFADLVRPQDWLSIVLIFVVAPLLWYYRGWRLALGALGLGVVWFLMPTLLLEDVNGHYTKLNEAHPFVKIWAVTGHWGVQQWLTFGVVAWAVVAFFTGATRRDAWLPAILAVALLITPPDKFDQVWAWVVAQAMQTWLFIQGLTVFEWFRVVAIVLTVVAIYLIIRGNFKSALGVGVVAALLFVAPAIINGLPSWQLRTGSSSVQTAKHGNCDGKEHTYTLSSSDSLINGGADCELVEWGRDAAVVMSGSGKSKAFPPGPSDTFDFRATTWKCAFAPSCHVAAIFCPRRAPKWDESRRVCVSDLRTANR